MTHFATILLSQSYYFKGILMQIWKSCNVFVYKKKLDKVDFAL